MSALLVQVLTYLIVKIGLPELQEHWPDAKNLIRGILDGVKSSDDPGAAIASIQSHADSVCPTPGDVIPK